MNSDRDRLVKMWLEALQQWWISLGSLAWVLAGVLLVLGILGCIAVVRLLLRREDQEPDSRRAIH